MNNVKRIAVKELFGFFSSITAFLFFGAFLAVTLFVFFWVETFFARNIADVRPMFEWMPLLMVFLVPALTMRMWSEERRSGTIEFLLTASATNLQLVLGKFAACMGLIAIALALTVPIPLTVSFLGPLDWGPVVGGYIAALFLAAAYTAIGLCVSARTDNQIVSLLISVVVCGVFLIVGADSLTSLFDGNIAELLKLMGAGSRFQAITRGVIDLRDLYYYVSIAGTFLCINVLELEQLRWANNPENNRHNEWKTISLLVVANLVTGNFWMQQVSAARLDVTAGQSYSISPATRSYLSRLNEPLLIRGYFSKKTHPLLQPLVPRMRDLIKEYAVAGNGKVRVEFLDPLEKPEIEKEAVEKYGIKPVVFQTANKYQASIANSYFDVLVKYGDQFQKLSWRDLIEIKPRPGERGIDVELRNPEYDLTSAIKKTLYSYQGAGNLFSGIERPVKFVGYVSKDSVLPEPLLKLKELLTDSLNLMKEKSNGKFSIEFVDPEADAKVAKKLESDYGFRPMSLGLLDPKTFWFYMTMQSGDQQLQVPLPEDLQQGALERALQSTLKRFSKGFIKTIGVVSPESPEQMGAPPDYQILREKLSDAYSLEGVNLATGVVPSNVDLLLVLAPARLSEQQVFAIDQFLMKGGTIILVTSTYEIKMDKGINCRKLDSGLSDWLKSFGISIEETMVLDKQNFPLPIPTRRNVAGYTIDEMQLVEYPYFVDIQSDGMSKESGVTGGLGQVMMNWASPIKLDTGDKNKNRKVVEILKSSLNSWTSADTNVEQPPPPEKGKTVLGRLTLAAMVEGSFDSYFKTKKSPLQSGGASKIPAASNMVDKSPDSARIFLFSSNSFLSDKIMFMASQALQSQYLKPVDLIQNVADWSLQDRDLLAIRGRGHFARTLIPLKQPFQSGFEYLNYGMALSGLGIVWIMRKQLRRRSQARFAGLLTSLRTQPAQEVKA